MSSQLHTLGTTASPGNTRITLNSETTDSTGKDNIRSERAKGRVFAGLALAGALAGIVALLVLIAYVLVDAWGWIDWQFITDVVVLDLMLSGLDGIEICRRLKREAQIMDLSDVDDGQFLVVTRTIDATRQVVGTFIALTAAMGTVAVVVILLVGLTIVRRAHDSQLAVRAYSAGDLSFRVHAAGTSAEAALVDEINAMAEALESRFAGIRDDREDLEAILSSMIEGVIVLNPDRTIRRINGAAARLFKVSPEQTVGQTVLECLRNAQIDEIASLTFGTDQPTERALTLYGDRIAHLQLHATRLAGGDSAETTGIVVVTSDVTRLQQLEKIRRDFVANVSHELRTPIASIKGFVETLQDGVLDDRKQSERFIEIIMRHTNRLNLIIEDLLTLSRLEQPDSELVLRVHSVGPTIAAAPDLDLRS